MTYKDQEDNYTALINNTISGIKGKKEKEGTLVSKEVKLIDKQLSESIE